MSSSCCTSECITKSPAADMHSPTAARTKQVRKMKMISPTNREVDIGQTLAADEYIGMVRREIMDGFMRDRAIEKVTHISEGLGLRVL